MTGSQKTQVKENKRAAALRDNLKKRKTFIKESSNASLSKKTNNAIGGGTEEDALKD